MRKRKTNFFAYTGLYWEALFTIVAKKPTLSGQLCRNALPQTKASHKIPHIRHRMPNRRIHLGGIRLKRFVFDFNAGVARVANITQG